MDVDVEPQSICQGTLLIVPLTYHDHPMCMSCRIDDAMTAARLQSRALRYPVQDRVDLPAVVGMLVVKQQFSGWLRRPRLIAACGLP